MAWPYLMGLLLAVWVGVSVPVCLALSRLIAGVSLDAIVEKRPDARG